MATHQKAQTRLAICCDVAIQCHRVVFVRLGGRRLDLDRTPVFMTHVVSYVTVQCCATGDQCNCKSAGLKCFYDSSCPGLGCGAEGHPNCRFCGDSAGQFQACPSKKEIEAAAQATTPKPKPKLKHIEAAAHVTTPQTEHAEKRDKPKMSGDKAIKAKSSSKPSDALIGQGLGSWETKLIAGLGCA